MSDSILRKKRRGKSATETQALERVRSRRTSKKALLERARALREEGDKIDHNEAEELVRSAAAEIAQEAVSGGSKKTAASREVMAEVRDEGKDLGLLVRDMRGIVREEVDKALEVMVQAAMHESESESDRSPSPPPRRRGTRRSKVRRQASRSTRRSRRYESESESESSPSPPPRRRSSRRSKRRVVSSDDDSDEGGSAAGAAGLSQQEQLAREIEAKNSAYAAAIMGF